MPDVMPAELFREDDGTGRILTVHDGSADGKALLQLRTAADPDVLVSRWWADPGLGLDLHRAICVASGTLPPVMLGRPDLASLLDSRERASFRGLHLRKSPDGGVTFRIGGNTETLPAHQVRQMAAVAVALADHPAPEFDPADVDSLAEALHAQECGCGNGPTESTRESAVTALRWMSAKGARDA